MLPALLDRLLFLLTCLRRPFFGLILLPIVMKRNIPNRFSGASDESISRTIDNTLGFPIGSPAIVRDAEDGTVLAISDSIPDGLTLDATPAQPSADLVAADSKWQTATERGKGSGSVAVRGASAANKGSDDGFHGGGKCTSFVIRDRGC